MADEIGDRKHVSCSMRVARSFFRSLDQEGSFLTAAHTEHILLGIPASWLANFMQGGASVSDADPTDRELEILKVLWDLGEGSVRDVHERTGAQTGANRSMITK